MPNAPFQIISTIYRLLGDYDSKQLREASRQKGLPRGLRMAIQALASEAESGQLTFPSKDSSASGASRSSWKRRPPRNGGGQAPSLSPNLPEEVYRKNLSDFLSSKSRFKNKSELMQFAKEVGFKDVIGPKESRKRAENRIVAFALSNADFRNRLDDIVPNDWSKQTSGWLDLILSSKE